MSDATQRTTEQLEEEIRALRAQIESGPEFQASTRESLLDAAFVAETLVRVGSLVAAELDGDKLVQRVTDEATTACRAEFGALFYKATNASGESYVLYTISGVPRENFSKFPMPRNTAVFAPTFAGAGPVRSDDITQDPRYGKESPYFGMPKGHLPVRSYLAVPVVLRNGEVLGGLFFGHAQPGIFTARDERIVSGIAAQAAVALDNARLFQKARQAEETTRRRARQAALGADVGAALTRGRSLREMLQQCAQAAVTHLDVAFARIWSLPEGGNVLELEASAGLYTHIDGPHARVPVGSFKIGLIAAEREPHLTNDVQQDPRVGNKDWAQREGMVAFAGYPLMVDSRVVGVFAMFARTLLSDDVLQALASVADTIALGIDRKRVDDSRALSEARTVAALAEAEAQRSRLYELFMKAPVPIAVWDGPEHTFRVANPLYVRMVNSRRGLIGRTLREAFPELASTAVIELFDRVYKSGEPFVAHEYPARIERENGLMELAYYAFSLEPVREQNGSVSGLMCVAVEVTEQVTARRRVETMALQLKRTNEELEQFAYVASHDLKAPLRGIANLSQWIEEDLGDKFTAESREHMTLLRGRVHRLEGLIDGILSYSRAGRVRDVAIDVDVGALLEETLELIAPPAGAELMVAPGMPTVRAERVPIEQVFMNLIGNALKHGKRGDVRVSIGWRDAGDEWEFSVADNGQGIAPQYHERIWGIFQTLEARDDVEGTGIGLSVVKKIVESRGGRAWVESDEGKGATFKFTWSKRAPGEQ